MTRIKTTSLRPDAGFTLIELMIVVGILGVLAAVAIQAYSKNVRSAHRTEVMADLANLAMKESTFFSVRGHFASTTTDASEATMYPVNPALLQNETTAVQWNTTAPGYHSDSVAAGTAYMRHGGGEHGFDVLNFLPEGAQSWCSYAVLSGGGTDGVDLPDGTDNDDEPPTGATLGGQVFPAAADRFYARDWFYAFGKCDFDRDGVLWEFTIPHFESQVSDGDGTRFGE